MVLELNDKEREVLKHVLEIFEDELKDERVKTDKRIYKEALHGQEGVVEGLLKKVA